VLRLLGPPSPSLTGTSSDVNANSVVARLEYGAASVLFCGDAGAEAERWLLASGQPLAARVVKVGHHGSRTSSQPEFVAAFAPRVALLSCGRRNRFHHPSPETLETFARLKVPVFRTDLRSDVGFLVTPTHLLLRERGRP
jgi:competence protein ComEC